jgi:hypothetical protein
MKKSFLMLAMAAICGSGMAQYQLPNSDFEEGFVVGFNGKHFIYTENKTVTTTEPLNWHGFPTLNGTKEMIYITGRAQGDKLCPSDDTRPNSKGTKSVYIKTTYVGLGKINQLANGVMTSGRVNSSSSTPDDPANNYNYSPGGSYTANKNQNKNFNPDFSGKPDAMKVWVKFVAKDATKKSEFPYASVNAVLHNSNKYQDPEGKTDYSDVKIAGASDLKIGEKDYDKWTELTIPFEYYHTAKEDKPAYMLVSFSTNTKPGKGTDGDMLFIDDLEFIYNSELKTATYDNQSLDFSTSNQINIDKVYDPALLKVTSNGEGATISRNYDAATGLLTITIKGNDISENESNYHTYKIQFAAPKTSKKYDAGLIVSVDETLYPEQESSINIYEMSNDTYMMQLSNFILGGGMPVGNIVLTGLKADASKVGMMSFESKQTIQISEGTDETHAGEWMGPGLGDVPVVFAGKMTDNRFFCNIGINMPEPLDQQIKVVFGKDFTVVNDQQAVTADEAGTKDVILNRSFAQGWNTICLPFNVKTTEIAEGAKAQEFFGVNANALNFDEVTEMQANTPYLFFAPQAIASGKVLENKNVVKGVAQSVTKEGYTFWGTYTKTDMQGKYGVANVEGVQKIMRGAAGSSLAGTRAYFTTTNTKANGMRINLGNNGITGINQINAENIQNAAAVYNLQGVKVSNHGTTNLPAGIYIMQGKKVIVK